MNLIPTGPTGYVILGVAGIAVLLIQMALSVGYGLALGRGPVGAKAVLWPVSLALLVACLPGFLLAALAYGFMAPPFSGHLKAFSDQSRGQQGINGMIGLVTSPFQRTARQ